MKGRIRIVTKTLGVILASTIIIGTFPASFDSSTAAQAVEKSETSVQCKNTKSEKKDEEPNFVDLVVNHAKQLKKQTKHFWASDSDKIYGDFKYTVSGDNVIITRYIGAGGSVIIPDEIEGKKVTEIGDKAFWDCKDVTSIKLTENIQVLGAMSIMGTSISEIVIPKSVKECRTSDEYGYTSGPFAQNGNLKSVTFEKGLKKIPDHIMECVGSEEVNIPDGVTSIGDSAFKNCSKLKEVRIPEGVTSIGDDAFERCSSLKGTVNIPKEVERIGTEAFSGCESIEKIKLNYNNSRIKTDKGEKNFELKLEDWCFYLCTGLKSINLNDNIKSIGDCAFERCSSLVDITLPESLESLGIQAFNGTGITEIKIPKNVKDCDPGYLINSGVFDGAKKLKKVVFEKGMKHIPAYIMDMGQSGDGTLETIVVPDTVTSIGAYAFYNCSSLNKIDLPKSVNKIDEYAFARCKGIEKIKLNSDQSSGNLEINDYSFSECSNLKDVIFSDNVTHIGKCAFYGCKSLKHINLPESLFSLGDFVFGNTGITEITIPKNLTEIKYEYSAEGPFCEADNLKKVIFENGTKKIPDNILRGVNNLVDITIPNSVESIGKNAFIECKSLTEITIPGSVTNIGYGVFVRCTSLKKVNIQNGVEIIDDEAFAGCRALKEITIPSSVTSMGGDVFSDSDNLHTIYYSGKAVGAPWGAKNATVKENPAEQSSEEFANMTEDQKNCYLQIKTALPNISTSDTATLLGPEVTLGAGKKINLFKYDMKFNLMDMSENFQVSMDYNNHKAKVLIGMSDSGSAKVQSDPNDTYWSSSYREVKSLVKKCGGKVNTTKLWNQFSSLRGKMKKSKLLKNASVGFDVSGNLVGYIEFNIDDAGNIIGFNEGGAATYLSAGASIKAPVGWIIYSEFGVTGKADGSIKLSYSTKKVIDFSGNMGLDVTPSVALGADAKVIDIKGGIDGTISGNCSIPVKTFKDSFSANLTGGLFLKIDTAIPKVYKHVRCDFSTLELYPELGKVTTKKNSVKYSKGKPISHEEINKLASSQTDLIDTAENSTVYESAKPVAINMGDGRILLTYIDDTYDKASGVATLMYRIYDNGKWSEAVPVAFTGHEDSSAELAVYDGNVYAIYENADKELTESMTESELADAFSLKIAKYDSSKKSFNVMKTIKPQSGSWIYKYDLVSDGKSLNAVWGENTSNDLLLEKGSTNVFTSALDGSSWSDGNKIFTSDDVVSDFDYGYVDGKLSLAVIDKGKVKIGDTVIKESNTADSINIYGGKVYFRDDGYLCTVIDDKVTKTSVFCSAQYYVDGNDVYWRQQNNFRSDVMRQDMSADSVAVKVTDDGGYVDGFSVIDMSDGNKGLIYTNQVVNENNTSNPYGATVLKFKHSSESKRADITNVGYDILDITPGGSNKLYITVANTGTEDITNPMVKVTDTNGTVLYDGKLSDDSTTLKAGTETEYIVEVKLPSDFSTSDLKVELYSEDDEFKESTKTQEVEYSQNDISVASSEADNVIVTNKSNTTAEDVTVTIKDSNEDGKVIATLNKGSLEGGKTLDIDVSEYWKSTSKNADIGLNAMYISVSQKGDEYSLDDNSIVLTKKVDESTDTPTDPTTPADPTTKPDDPKEPSAPTTKPDDPNAPSQGEETKPSTGESDQGETKPSQGEETKPSTGESNQGETKPSQGEETKPSTGGSDSGSTSGGSQQSRTGTTTPSTNPGNPSSGSTGGSATPSVPSGGGSIGGGGLPSIPSVPSAGGSTDGGVFAPGEGLPGTGTDSGTTVIPTTSTDDKTDDGSYDENVDQPTTLNIKNKKTYKKSKKITIKDADGIFTIQIKGKKSKTIKVNGKVKYSFKLSKYKKYLNKKSKWTKIIITDTNVNKKIIKIKVK